MHTGNESGCPFLLGYIGTYAGAGGVGGGGGGGYLSMNQAGGGGGGGGYGGGGGGAGFSSFLSMSGGAGGGGGSFDAGQMPLLTSGTNTGDGFVTITQVDGPVGGITVPEPSSLALLLGAACALAVLRCRKGRQRSAVGRLRMAGW